MIFGLFLLSGYVHAQNIEETLAAQYYQSGEFDKAATLYKKLLDNNPASNFYYDSYMNCLLNLKDYPTAEKELKKLIKKNSRAVYLQVDLGYIYTLEGDTKKSKEQFDQIVDDLDSRGNPADENRISAVAATFARRGQTEYAIKTYQKGRKILHDPAAFSLDIAGLYKTAGDYPDMFDEYMRILDANPYDFETVKDYLQETVMQDGPYDIFRKMLLKKVQEKPDNIAYSEMLSWLFIQHKDFNSAFIQSKAIDRKQREGGRKLVELARIVSDNQDYDLAERIYQAVIDQGRDAMYYIPAQQGLLEIRYDRITESNKFTQADIDVLTKSYTDFLNAYGRTRQESGEIVLKLAEIEARYNNQVPDAIAQLKDYIDLHPDKVMEGRAKLALGDYSLLNGDVWEASLYYSQVEKLFKDDEMGHEAKFRNAKLSFYRGDFDWAKAQLDVLKSSTSELIANDAMQLALLIQDNLGLDTTAKPLQLYAEADFFIFKGMFPQAEKKLDSINILYPNHSLSDEVLMERATIAARQHDYQKALGYYEKIYTDYGKDILADDALFKAAQVEDKNLNEPEKAKELYLKLITGYVGSVYGVEAGKRYRQLRGDAVN
jgi:tetratricopeptide (TPR) repeat protein